MRPARICRLHPQHLRCGGGRNGDPHLGTLRDQAPADGQRRAFEYFRPSGVERCSSLRNAGCRAPETDHETAARDEEHAGISSDDGNSLCPLAIWPCSRDAVDPPSANGHLSRNGFWRRIKGRICRAEPTLFKSIVGSAMSGLDVPARTGARLAVTPTKLSVQGFRFDLE
jgi:hypothetical protein